MTREVGATSNAAVRKAMENAEASIKMPLPFFARLKFLFSSRLATEYIAQFDKTVTVK